MVAHSIPKRIAVHAEAEFAEQPDPDTVDRLLYRTALGGAKRGHVVAFTGDTAEARTETPRVQ